MTNFGAGRAVALLAAIAVAQVVGCAHPIPFALPGSGSSPSPGVSPSPGASPSPGSSASPAPCGTPDTNATEFIAMTSTATATMDPSFGIVNGYTDQYIGNVPASVANVIRVSSSAVVQFVNLEPLAPTPNPPATPTVIFHSAAALPTAFPSPSYQFPAQEQVALGSQVSSTPWSTGPVGQDPINFFICYSQPFTLPAGPGVYAFGDLTYFGLSNTRDVIVVSGSEKPRHRMPLRLQRATPRP
jgi:hypothetical protein